MVEVVENNRMSFRHYMCGSLRLCFLLILTASAFAGSGDRPQWGDRHSRNMVSDEEDLPATFDPETAVNVRWAQALGTACYSTPVVSQGKVLVGTNNGQPRDPRHEGDRGVLMCFNETDGSLVWQLVVPKLSEDRYLDWPKAGISSPATVEGNRVFLVTNRNEVVSLDLHGMADGNDGPFLDEGRHMTPEGESLLAVGPLDADIIWLFDLRSALGVRPHDSAHSSILVDGSYLYINTSNGLNSQHDGVEKPQAPSLVVLDKTTGKLVAQDHENIGPGIFHCTWASPSLGEVNGRRLVFFGGGDGVLYAFDALKPEDNQGPKTSRHRLLATSSEETPRSGRFLDRVWKFDPDPTAPKKNIHQYIGNRRESPSTIMSMPVFDDGRIYLTTGGDIWWGKRQSWIKCIDASQTGDITESGLIWSYPLEHHSCSTPSIQDGLVYVADTAGKVHCLDAMTGKPYWVHSAGGEIWASTLTADGKVYIGTRRGNFWALATGREKRVLGSVRMNDPIISTAVAANGTLYVSTLYQLYALCEDSP